MASMTEDFPDPVGPTSAKKSLPSKSISVGSLKLVKPESSRRRGRMSLLVQLVEERDESLVFDLFLVQVGEKELVGGEIASIERLLSVPARGLVLDDHLDRVGEQ